ncbi:glutamate/aspartate ABC transporter [Trinickia caryophylli]|uniref:Amino acid ABC transporter substrate-binding protein, PAAT family n=2 Tax=Trinickia caryophylli TaxID=28094 RepID=A0A1X7FS47_TRICW|nr:amino acid ABC transporter substrate-binding protein [Trinickia caryophylli]TRX15339.1 transporter substrate-binding domain-containing protein [Trinickia caryophylli]GLU33706.1 glutamate/aspartate ABC transporter [Trinickia caryophylli]SMF57749.1 amino acid ABC transporter substrate-binding protein, PAAT family [Trinickia caryophylli]
MGIVKRITAACFAIGVAAVAPDLCAQTLKKIAQTNTITVSYRESAVPFSYLLTPHKPAGFSVDLTEAIIDAVRKQLGRPELHVAYLPVTGQNRIPLLVNGTYDLGCGSTTNNAARGKEVAFSISFFFAGTRVLVKRGSGIANYGDLAHKRVATVAGSTNQKVIEQYGQEHGLGIETVAGKDYGDALQLLLADRAEALALDDILLYGLKANASDPASLEVVGDTLQVEPYGCMVRKDDPAFKQLVDTTIARMMKSGEFTRLYEKWFEQPIPPKGITLGMPMSERLRANLSALSDKPER